MKTKNQLNFALKQLASNHLQIQSFGYGQKFEQQAVEGVGYPMMWVICNDETLANGLLSYNYRIIIADRVRKDETNELEVESDTDIIIKDVISYMHRYCLQNQLTLNESTTISPFWEDWSDEVTGHFCDLSFEDFFDFDSCNLPLADEIPEGDFVETNGIFFSNSIYSKALTIPSPVITDDIPIFFTYSSIIVRQINDVVTGTNPSLAYNIYFSADKNDASPSKIWTTDRIVNVQDGAETEVFDTKIIPANNWVWIKFSSITGLVNLFSTNLFYKITI